MADWGKMQPQVCHDYSVGTAGGSSDLSDFIGNLSLVNGAPQRGGNLPARSEEQSGVEELGCGRGDNQAIWVATVLNISLGRLTNCSQNVIFPSSGLPIRFCGSLIQVCSSALLSSALGLLGSHSRILYTSRVFYIFTAVQFC